MILTDAGQNTWERRWFVLKRSGVICESSKHGTDVCYGCDRPYLHMYSRSNELEEVGVVSLTGTNVESDPQKEMLLGVRVFFICPSIYLSPDVCLNRNRSRSRSSQRRILMRWPHPARRSCNRGQ